MNEILVIDTPERFQSAVRRAVELLRAGEVVALPTETVYGLAANCWDERAVGRVFEIKGRPQYNPIIVHVADLEMARACAADWPELADRLAAAFWPGPLTLVLGRTERIPDIVTAGGKTVGIRWPAHPFIQAVIRACGFPLAVPSANRSGEVSPTTAEHARRSLGEQIPLIVDGGASQVGIESTVVDLMDTPPRLLRPGMIHSESLLAVTGELALGFGDSVEVLRSPGLLRRHYAPRAKLICLGWEDEADLARQLERFPAKDKIQVIAHSQVPSGAGLGGVSVIPHDPEAYARALYAELHRCDESGAELIVVEAVPERAEWQGIADRLGRAGSQLVS